MGKSNFVWGASSLSDDIFNNLSKTHHKEKVYENSFAYDWGQSMLNSKYERPFEEVLVRNNNEDFVSEYGENHAYFDEDKNYKKSIQRDYGNNDELDDEDYIFEFNREDDTDDWFNRFKHLLFTRFCFLYFQIWNFESSSPFDKILI